MTKRASTKGASYSVLIIIQRAWLPLFVVFSLIFLATYFFRNVSEFRHPLKFSLPLLLVTIVLSAIYWVIASIVWRHVVTFTSSARLSFLQSFTQLVMVNFGKYMPGKVWGILARGAQLKRYGVTSGEAASTTYYEQYLLLHASLVLCCLLGSFYLPVPGPIIGAVAAFIIAIVGTKLRAVGVQIFLYVLGKLRRDDQAKLNVIAEKLYLALLAKFILLWLCNSAVFVSLFLTFFEVEITLRLLLVLALANITGVTLGFFALFAPGGIGIREAVISSVLASVIPYADAVFLSVLYRMWLIVSELVAGVIALAARKLSGEDKKMNPQEM